MPRTAQVTVLEPGFFTPRIVMHMCSASKTTTTPYGFSRSIIVSATVEVIRSCNWGAASTASTARASLLSPVTRPSRGCKRHGPSRKTERDDVRKWREKRYILHQHQFLMILVENHGKAFTRILVRSLEKISSYIERRGLVSPLTPPDRDPHLRRPGSSARLASIFAMIHCQ